MERLLITQDFYKNMQYFNLPIVDKYFFAIFVS
jgi:hypothetical protein